MHCDCNAYHAVSRPLSCTWVTKTVTMLDSFAVPFVAQDITAESKDDESDGTDAPPQAKLE